MDELLLKLRLLAKAEMILFRLHLQRTMRQVLFSLAALLLAVLAMAMLNVAFYLYLVPRLEGAGAALVVALVDLGIAASVLLVAGRQQGGAEYEAAKELRERIMVDLAADVERVKIQLTDLHDDIRQIRATASGLFQTGGFSFASLVPWFTMLFRFFRRRKDA